MSSNHRNKPTQQRSRPAREHQVPVDYQPRRWIITGEEDKHMVLCRYNPTHIVTEVDLQSHLNICPDARFLREFVDK